MPRSALLGPHLRFRIVPLRTADGAEEDGVGLPGLVEHGVGERGAVRVDRAAADQLFGKFEALREELAGPLEDEHRLRGHLRADAVAGKNENAMTQGPTLLCTWTSEYRLRCSSLFSAFTNASALAMMMSCVRLGRETAMPFSRTRHETSPCASVPPVMALTW